MKVCRDQPGFSKGEAYSALFCLYHYFGVRPQTCRRHGWSDGMTTMLWMRSPTSILFSILMSHPSIEWWTAIFTIWSTNFSISVGSLSSREHFSNPSSHSVINVPEINKEPLWMWMCEDWLVDWLSSELAHGRQYITTRNCMLCLTSAISTDGYAGYLGYNIWHCGCCRWMHVLIIISEGATANWTFTFQTKHTKVSDVVIFSTADKVQFGMILWPVSSTFRSPRTLRARVVLSKYGCVFPDNRCIWVHQTEITSKLLHLFARPMPISEIRSFFP